ncbi:MAG: aldehyde dehydrogenase family protein, partial [Nevskiaceae bacterium]
MSTVRPLDRLMLIDGAMTAGEGGAAGDWIDSHSPATLEPLGRVPNATAGDVDRAVVASARAQREWAALSVWARASALRNLAAAIRARGGEILELEARDTGNTLAKLQADVQIAAGYLDYFGGLGSELKGETVPATASG